MPIKDNTFAIEKIVLARTVYDFKPQSGQSFPVGLAVQLAPLELQIWKDFSTVRPAPLSAAGGLMGCVMEEFATATSGGYDGKGSVVAPAVAALGSGSTIRITTGGVHSGVLIDNSGANAAALVNLGQLVVSPVTIGRLQQNSVAASPRTMMGVVMLPSVNPFTNLGSGTVVAATQTITVGGAPATGDVITIPVQVNFSAGAAAFGIAQYRNVVTTLTAAQAATTTTAAAAIVAAIAADAQASIFYSATNAANVVTVTVVAAKFKVTIAGYDANHGAEFFLTTSGAMGNYLSFGAATVVGGTTVVYGGANSGYTGYPATSPLFTGGTGYFGVCPAYLGAWNSV